MASAARCRWLRHDACAQRRWLSHPVLIDIRKFPLRQTHRGLLGGSVRASSSTCPSRRNLARRVPDPDGDQRVRTRQGAQGAPALGPMTLCSDVVRSRRTLQCAWDATSAYRPFWINLQARYDLDVANRTVKKKIEQEVAPRNAA